MPLKSYHSFLNLHKYSIINWSLSSIFYLNDKEILRAGGGNLGHKYDSNFPNRASGGIGNFSNGKNGEIGCTYQ